MHQLHHAIGASRHQTKEDVVRMCQKWYDYMQPGWCQPVRQEFMENECEALPGVAYPGVRDNRSTLNTKTGYDDDDDDLTTHECFIHKNYIKIIIVLTCIIHNYYFYLYLSLYISLLLKCNTWQFTHICIEWAYKKTRRDIFCGTNWTLL